MGDFLNNYPETSYSTASATQPATSTTTSAFGSTNNNQESQQAGNNTSYANSQIDPQLVTNSFNTANAGKQSSYGQNQAMASYDMQDGQNGSSNNMNYDPQFNTFNSSNMGGYQNNYSDMSYGSANQQQQHAQQQQHFYDRQQQQGSGYQREVSDNFGTVSAGPPSPGKMDMLPHGHTNHYTSSTSNPSNITSTSQQQQQQQKSRPSNANAQGGAEYDGSSQASHLARAPTTKGSSTTSEFTKRKNWSQRIVEEMQDVLHVLSPSGIFLFISPSIYEITGYTPEELVGRGITDFIERDDIDNFTRDFSESIQTNQALTTYIRFRRKDEQGVLFEVTGQPYYTTATSSPQNNMVRTSSSSSNTNDSNSPADATMSSRKPPPSSSSNETVCKCFFAMARLYPGKNNAMLDSFLELKMENEKLRERLAEIYREIEGDNVEANIVAGTSIIDTTASISTMGSEGTNEPRQISGYPSRLLGQPNQNQQQQPIQPSPSNPYAMSTENEVPKSATSSSFPSTFYNYPTSSAQNPYSTQNLQQIQPNNNNNNNNQYNADASTSQLRGTAISQDSLLVSSAGLLPSSGNTYGALGIGISNNAHRNNNSSGPSNQYTSNNASKGANNNQDYAGDTSMRDDGDPANKKKKPKKQRVDEGEFVCRDCGTVDSPEWRRGPQGPKTLCNACGLRWAKKNKQSRNSIGGMEGIA